MADPPRRVRFPLFELQRGPTLPMADIALRRFDVNPCGICGGNLAEAEHETGPVHAVGVEFTRLLAKGYVPLWGRAVVTVLNRLKLGAPADDYEFWRFDWKVEFPSEGVRVVGGVPWVPRATALTVYEDEGSGPCTRKVLRTALELQPAPWVQAVGAVRLRFGAAAAAVRRRGDVRGLLALGPVRLPGLSYLSEILVAPISNRRDYTSLGRRVFSIEPLDPPREKP